MSSTKVSRILYSLVTPAAASGAKEGRNWDWRTAGGLMGHEIGAGALASSFTPLSKVSARRETGPVRRHAFARRVLSAALCGDFIGVRHLGRRPLG